MNEENNNRNNPEVMPLPALEVKKFHKTHPGAKRNVAMFDLGLAGHFIIKGLTLTKNKTGALSVRFPQKRSANKDVAHPISSLAFQAVLEMASKEFNKVTQSQGLSQSSLKELLHV